VNYHSMSSEFVSSNAIDSMERLVSEMITESSLPDWTIATLVPTYSDYNDFRIDLLESSAINPHAHHHCHYYIL